MKLLTVHFFQPPTISYLFGPNILFSTLYSMKYEIHTKRSCILQIAIRLHLAFKERLGISSESHNNNDSKQVYSLH
jgi:hypothetical protein